MIEAFMAAYRSEVPFVKDDIIMYKMIQKSVDFLRRYHFDY